MAHEMAHEGRQPKALDGVSVAKTETPPMNTESQDDLDTPIAPPKPKPPAPEDGVRPDAKDEDGDPPPALRSFPDYPE